MSDNELDPCPACGALPCDWVNDPHGGGGYNNAVAQIVIWRLARAAAIIGRQAGVGGIETAGSIVSYLAEHRAEIAKLMDGSLSVLDWPDKWHVHGCLTWHGQDGKIYDPATVRDGEIAA